MNDIDIQIAIELLSIRVLLEEMNPVFFVDSDIPSITRKVDDLTRLAERMVAA